MREKVKYACKDGIGLITLSRPDALNALDAQMIGQLDEIAGTLKRQDDVLALIVTGEGRAFAAGADIEAQAGLDVAGGKKWSVRGNAALRKIEKLNIPTIAAVNGFALGGGFELAMSCDLIIASEKAKFGHPEVTLGIIPGFAGTQRLPKRVGLAKAKELILTGEIIDAKTAKEIGLVNHVFAPEDFLEKTYVIAEKMAKNAPIAVRLANEALKRGAYLDIEAGISVESDLFAMCFDTEDQKEGMGAFLEKRKAVFRNR